MAGNIGDEAGIQMFFRAGIALFIVFCVGSAEGSPIRSAEVEREAPALARLPLLAASEVRQPADASITSSLAASAMGGAQDVTLAIARDEPDVGAARRTAISLSLPLTSPLGSPIPLGTPLSPSP